MWHCANNTKRNILKMDKLNLKFHCERFEKALLSVVPCFPLYFFLLCLYHLQGQTATRTRRWYRLAERWRSMSAQSATAHTRKARGRLSVKPPAVRTSASGARDWHGDERGTLARNTSAEPHAHSQPFTQSTGHQGRTAPLKHFSINTVVTPVLLKRCFYESL